MKIKPRKTAEKSHKNLIFYSWVDRNIENRLNRQKY
nr:MAG TPA: hypothetical protein [Caudoviricetes sp.]